MKQWTIIGLVVYGLVCLEIGYFLSTHFYSVPPSSQKDIAKGIPSFLLSPLTIDFFTQIPAKDFVSLSDWTIGTWGTLVSRTDSEVVLLQGKNIQHYPFPASARKYFSLWDAAKQETHDVPETIFHTGDAVTLYFTWGTKDGVLEEVRIAKNQTE